MSQDPFGWHCKRIILLNYLIKVPELVEGEKKGANPSAGSGTLLDSKVKHFDLAGIALFPYYCYLLINDIFLPTNDTCLLQLAMWQQLLNNGILFIYLWVLVF